MLGKSILMFLVIALGVSASRATSIVVKASKDHIILAADTRRALLTKDTSVHPEVYDDQCKIALLGKVAVGISGSVDYHPIDSNDSVTDWDALEDAKDVFLNHSGNLASMANEWNRRAVQHFVLYYKANKFRVLDYAKNNSDYALLEALFAGWGRDDKPEVIMVKVMVNLRVEGHISGNATTYGVSERPYTSNETTRQLIEGSIQQAKDTAAKWKSESQHIAQSEQDWRYVAFIIKATAGYDPTVGKTINVVEIKRSGSYRWIRNYCCRK